MTRVLLVRHAAFDGVGDILAGRTDVRLNEVGRAQAAALAAAMRTERVAVVCSSPRERAVETARAVAAGSDLEVVIDAAFDELDLGEWTGRRISELAADRRWAAFNDARASARIPGGETMVEVQARAMAGLERLCGAQPDGTVIVVSHGDVIRAVLALLLGAPIDSMLRFTVDPASVSTVVLGNGVPHVLEINRRCV